MKIKGHGFLEDSPIKAPDQIPPLRRSLVGEARAEQYIDPFDNEEATGLRLNASGARGQQVEGGWSGLEGLLGQGEVAIVGEGGGAGCVVLPVEVGHLGAEGEQCLVG